MHSCRVFNVSGKFIRGEFSKTGVLLYKISWVTLSVTLRREISRRDVKRSPLCHVATWITTSRRGSPRRDVSFFEASVTSRREISRRDVIFIFLCHIATWDFTSRRHLVMLSVTSRHETSRHDVIWLCPLPRRDVGFHVATWAC